MDKHENSQKSWEIASPFPRFLARKLTFVVQYAHVSAEKQEEGLISLGNLRAFTFKELLLATDNFSTKNILGTGGFGNVYKGKLGDGTVVAVKRLKDVVGTTGESQFRTELEMISLAVHRNLLRVVGYCATSTERLLVYPYMSNGSVASRLKGLCLKSFW